MAEPTRWYLPDRGLLVAFEVRRRMRGLKGFLLVLGYLLLLIAGIGISILPEYPFDALPYSHWAKKGNSTFYLMMVLQNLLLLVVCPALTAGTITEERQRGTFEFLYLCNMSNFAILWQKLIGALAQPFFLLLAGLPVLGVIVFGFGGVSLLEFVGGFVVSLLIALGSGSLGMFASCLCKRLWSSFLCAYLLTFATVFCCPCLIFIAPIILLAVSETIQLFAPEEISVKKY